MDAAIILPSSLRSEGEAIQYSPALAYELPISIASIASRPRR